MASSSNRRKVELMLLVAVQIVLVFGLALTYFGKAATTTWPASPVNINAATAGQLAQALSVDKTAAGQLVAERDSRKGHQWPAVFDLRHAKGLKDVPTTPIDARFVARTPREVAVGYWGGVALFVLAFFGVHVLLRKAAPNADSFLLPLIAFLSGLGMMMLHAIKDPYRDTFAFSGQVWGIVFYGLLALVIPLTRPFGQLALRRYQYAYAALAVVLMLLLFVFGHGPGGIHIRLFGFEPIEIIKVLLVLFAVSYLTERHGGMTDPLRFLPRLQDFGPLAAIYLFALSLFVLVKDLGPAVLLFGTFLALLYLTTQRAIYPLFGTLLLVLAAFVGYHLHFGFFATRVLMWLRPWDNNDPHGAQLAQGLWGMATGGLTGSGLGLGSPDVMPRAGSDLIFATIGEEMGLIGTLAVLLVYVLLIARGFLIARRAVTEFDRLLAAGLTTLLALQTMIIVGGVTGLVPLTGITLPFVSFGASSLVANFFAIGLLLHISGKTLPSTVVDRATPEWTRAARVLVMGCAAYLLLGIGVARLMLVQGVQDRDIATRLLLTPQADKVSRATINPRLLLYANHIPRGRILDRNGTVLARDADPNGDEGATSLLTPDGRSRVYAGGEACGHLLYSTEAPSSSVNPLGQNARLRGFETYTSLLPFYRSQWEPFHKTPKGDDIALAIDLPLQQAALDALRKTAHSLHDRRTGKPKNKGAAVAIEVSTGEVLAAVSLPAFDPSKQTPKTWAALNADAKNSPLLNRAVQGTYPPGSAFKIVSAVSAFEHGKASVIFSCPHTDYNVHWRFGDKNYSRRRITDEEGFVPHGQTDMAKALRVSCNVYFAHLGIDLGAEALEETATQKFGLSHMPLVAKLGEDLPDCAYGQGADLMTPLEMAHVAQGVANNGQLLPVKLVKGPQYLGTGEPILSPDQATQLQQMLAGVTSEGTARGVFDSLRISVAGKTGSAQNNQGDKTTHSWFAGFAPATRPTIAFACIVENGGFGRDAAAPVCREIVRKALQ